MSFVVFVALLSSLTYGGSDFLGALTARSLTVLKATVAIYATAAVTVTVGLAVTPWTFSERALWAGSVAGFFAVVGMLTFYAALAIGPMSLLAPLIALIQTAVPVTVSATTGQDLPPITWLAVGLGLVATTLISVPPRAANSGRTIGRITPRGALLALASGVTLGFSVVWLDSAPADSALFPAFLDVVVGLALLLPLLAVPGLRRSDRWLGDPTARTLEQRVRFRVWWMAAAAGVLLGVGSIFLVVALHAGNLAVVAVLLSLYPLTTVVLAWVVLKERLSVVQFVGIALAIVVAVMLGMS